MGAALSQSFWNPVPTITEKNCPDQTGKVFLITGGYAGIGFELCHILYEHNATVYIAGRSQQKALDAIRKIKDSSPKSTGRLEFVQMDFTDLASVKTGVQTFLSRQSRLDVLVNNAGVMYNDNDQSRHAEIHMMTNCIGPCLLYKLLLPTLERTAASASTGTVRVLWAGSIGVHIASPQPGGMEIDENGRPKDHTQNALLGYGQTKVGNVFLGSVYAKSTPDTGVVHASFNPGNLRSELQRNWQGFDMVIMKWFFYPTIYGAYTELWSATALELTPDRSGAYIWPWGRFGSLPAGIQVSLKDPSEGGTGVASKFVSWCEKQIQPHM